jgi:hypothetical protein
MSIFKEYWNYMVQKHGHTLQQGSKLQAIQMKFLSGVVGQKVDRIWNKYISWELKM